MIKAAKLLIVQEDETCKTEPGWTWDFKERISIPISTSSLGPPNPALLHTFGDITILHLLGAFMNKPQWREWLVGSFASHRSARLD